MNGNLTEMWNQLTVFAIILNYVLVGARAAPSDATALNSLSRVKRNDPNSSIITLIRALLEQIGDSDIDEESAKGPLSSIIDNLKPLVAKIVVPILICGLTELVELIKETDVRDISMRLVMRPTIQLPMIGVGGVAPGPMVPGPGEMVTEDVAHRGGNNVNGIGTAIGMLSKIIMDLIADPKTPKNGKIGKYQES